MPSNLLYISIQAAHAPNLHNFHMSQWNLMFCSIVIPPRSVLKWLSHRWSIGPNMVIWHWHHPQTKFVSGTSMVSHISVVLACTYIAVVVESKHIIFICKFEYIEVFNYGVFQELQNGWESCWKWARQWWGAIRTDIQKVIATISIGRIKCIFINSENCKYL
jgi:hypothetical protein